MNRVELIQQVLARIEKDLLKRVGRGYDMSDFEMYSFNQIWDTTSLGLIGPSDVASVMATTYVFLPKEKTGLNMGYVYFDDKFAYEVNPQNKAFQKDLKNCKMNGQIDAYKYLTK